MKTIFVTVIEELSNVGEWFNANKVLRKTIKLKKCMFLVKRLRIDILPIKVPKLNFAGRTTELKMSLKHLGVMLDENIS